VTARTVILGIKAKIYIDKCSTDASQHTYTDFNTAVSLEMRCHWLVS